ncbi:hypothetical protein [Peribacillus sp. TH24]|uniref:hypothetical protein n=1 Tax=Peribacillus sp. TH24 TaxID=2798483 RepID=UPI00191382CA|nr:hypothetical protein [Peribacillus sp. TH24]MBK5447038.1 hypothetical protein [Peribacillus sp. TH24]MBK5447069.1 hypothetical protein [Peribacillus sp. TH24]
MSKVGFIVKIRAKGKDYFYLRKSVREKKQVYKENLYSFGTREKALDNLMLWGKSIDNLPENLRELGYDLEDISSWKEQIMNK